MNLNSHSCLHCYYKFPQSFIYFEKNFLTLKWQKKIIYLLSRHADSNILCVKSLKLCTSQQQPFLPLYGCLKKLHWHNKSRPLASAALLFIVFCALRFVLHNQPCSRRSGKEHWFIPEKQPTMAFCRWWSFAHFGEATPEWIPHIFCHAFVCAQFDGLTRHLHLMPAASTAFVRKLRVLY